MESERKELRKSRKAAAEEQRQIDAGLSEALHSRSGRALIWWLLDQMEYGNDTFTGNALTSAYRQGLQRGALLIAERAMRADNGAFLSLLKEKYDERAKGEQAGVEEEEDE